MLIFFKRGNAAPCGAWPQPASPKRSRAAERISFASP
jgi:hypothetical protein